MGAANHLDSLPRINLSTPHPNAKCTGLEADYNLGTSCRYNSVANLKLQEFSAVLVVSCDVCWCDVLNVGTSAGCSCAC